MTFSRLTPQLSLLQFEEIRKTFGRCASWAVWSSPESDGKTDISSLAPFSLPDLTETIKILQPNIIFVALNFSVSTPMLDFSNFHSSNSSAQDYKLRIALRGTPFWGGYMTDIIKDHVQLRAADVLLDLRDDPTIESRNISRFRDELELLNVKAPLLVAIGGHSYKILKRNFADEFKVVQITHYSHFVNPSVYRTQVLSILNAANVWP